jgi:hypothetical protein
MPIPFVPYQKEYEEQIRILAALLQGRLGPLKGGASMIPSPYPALAGTFRQREVEIGLIEEASRAGSDPLSTDKYLLLNMQCSCTLEMKAGPKGWFWKLDSLIWWRRISTGNKTLDSNYTITTPERLRSRRLLSHKKTQNLLIQLSPFHTLQLVDRHLRIRYLITSQQVFQARTLGVVLHRMDRLARLTENLA